MINSYNLVERKSVAMVCEGKKKKKFLTIAALTFHATKVLAGITKGLPEEICS